MTAKFITRNEIINLPVVSYELSPIHVAGENICFLNICLDDEFNKLTKQYIYNIEIDDIIAASCCEILHFHYSINKGFEVTMISTYTTIKPFFLTKIVPHKKVQDYAFDLNILYEL